MATHALRMTSTSGARQFGRRGDRIASAARLIKTHLRFESLENRLVLSTVSLSSSAALQFAREVQASLNTSAEVSRAAVSASPLMSDTMQAFGSRCNYEWVNDTPHGCSAATWCDTTAECDPEPECDPVPQSQNREGCETACDGQVPGTADGYDCEPRCETDEWCEERPPCDSVPTVASYERCEERPNCEVRRECDSNQNEVKSRGKEDCDPCGNSDARKRGERGQSCEVERQCETKQRCNTTPNCDDNVPASAARKNASDQSGMSEKIARAMESCFGDQRFMSQVSRW